MRIDVKYEIVNAIDILHLFLWIVRNCVAYFSIAPKYSATQNETYKLTIDEWKWLNCDLEYTGIL